MRNSYVLLVALIMLMANCKKDSEEDKVNSTWTINGKSYSTEKTFYSVADDALVATNNMNFTEATTAIGLEFVEKPTSSGAYEVIESTKDGPYPGEVYMEIVIDGINYYESAGQRGDYISVAILSGGRLKVTFNNITFVDDNNNKVKASGTIIEQ